MIDDAFLKEMKQLLQDRLAELSAVEEQNRRDRAPVELDQTRVGRLSRMDAMQHQAMASAQGERRRLERMRIEAALNRIEDETFGDCLRCGDEISLARLRVDPAIPVCVVCADRQ